MIIIGFEVGQRLRYIRYESLGHGGKNKSNRIIIDGHITQITPVLIHVRDTKTRRMNSFSNADVHCGCVKFLTDHL